MSYARWGEDGSNVYVFGTGDEIVCMQCTLDPDPGGSFSTRQPGEMLAHLKRHREAGHIVPERAFERLFLEAEPKP